MRRQDKWCDLTSLHWYWDSVSLSNILCGAQTTLEFNAMFLMCVSCSLVLKKGEANTDNDLIVISVRSPLVPPLPLYPLDSLRPPSLPCLVDAKLHKSSSCQSSHCLCGRFLKCLKLLLHFMTTLSRSSLPPTKLTPLQIPAL